MVSTRRKVTVCVVGAMCASAPPAEGFTPPGCSGEQRKRESERTNFSRLPARACTTFVAVFLSRRVCAERVFVERPAFGCPLFGSVLVKCQALVMVISDLYCLVNPSFSWSDAISLIDTLDVSTLIPSSFEPKKNVGGAVVKPTDELVRVRTAPLYRRVS